MEKIPNKGMQNRQFQPPSAPLPIFEEGGNPRSAVFIQNAGDRNLEEERQNMDPSKGVETKPMKKKIKKRHRYFQVDDEELERMEARWKKFEEEEDVFDDPFDLPGPEVDEVFLRSDSDSDLENNNHYEFDNGERIGENVKSSNFTREEVNQVPVNREEWKIQMDDEEKMYKYMLYKKIRRPTKEQKKMLRDANRKSQGFDIPLLPGIGTTIPYRVDLTSKQTAYETVRLSKLALGWYNKDKGTNYALQRIVKSTGKPCAFVIFCITFLAKDDPAIPAETFQARVWVKFNFDVHIMMCRKKGDHDPGLLVANYDDDDDDDRSPKDEDGDNDNDSEEDDDQPQL